MALRKFGLLPDSATYKVSEGADAIRTKLDGGLGRYRLDVIGATKTVEVQWSLNRAGYNYVRAFYNSYANLSGSPFLIDLIIDDQAPEEHTAYILPESFSLASHRGLLYVVKATLEVKPIKRTEGYYELIVTLFDEYGSNYDQEASDVFDALSNLVNIKLPTV